MHVLTISLNWIIIETDSVAAISVLARSQSLSWLSRPLSVPLETWPDNSRDRACPKPPSNRNLSWIIWQRAWSREWKSHRLTVRAPKTADGSNRASHSACAIDGTGNRRGVGGASPEGDWLCYESQCDRMLTNTS